jgi:hypothetical protein
MDNAIVVDILKAPIEVGDQAVYVSTGRYAERGVVQVVQVKKRIQVIWLKRDRNSYSDGKPFWIEPAAIFVVKEFKGDAPALREV